jgi:Na+/H+-dicarboxylate symporter
MLNISEIIQTIRQLIDVRLQLIKDEVQEQFSRLMTKIVVLVLIGVSALMVLLFASIGLGFYLSEVVESTALGFLYVALIYLVLFIILYLLKNADALQVSVHRVIRVFMFNPKKNH